MVLGLLTFGEGEAIVRGGPVIGGGGGGAATVLGFPIGGGGIGCCWLAGACGGGLNGEGMAVAAVLGTARLGTFFTKPSGMSFQAGALHALREDWADVPRREAPACGGGGGG